MSKIPPEYMDVKNMEGTGGRVSVRNIVAYQIGWGKLLIGWYESGKDGMTPEMPGEGFHSWDYVGLARHFYQKYSFKGLQEQLAALEKIVETIILIVEKEHEQGQLDKLNVWSWCTLKSGKHWPLSKWIRVNTIAPYKKASTMIRKASRK